MKREGKVGRNEPCPCGSGRKYKKCHWNRVSAAPIPYHKSAKELLRLRVGEQKCLHPMPGNAQCSDKVIEAHSISRNAALTKIARDHQVYQIDGNPFTIAKAEGEPQLKLEYIRSATTFTGFCSAHDSTLFRPIDQGGISPTREQAFLLHYRSLCRELYVKRPTLATNELLREADRGKSVRFQQMVQGFVTARGVSIKDALGQLEKDKATCDQMLTTRDFSTLQGAYVRFRKTPTLACAGYTQPTFDFAGGEIQDIADMSTPFLSLSFTLLPDDTGGVAVFSWLPDADAVCRRFVESLMRLGDDRMSDALVLYIFDSFENFAAQPEWWESLPDTAKDDLKWNALNGTDMAFAYDSATLIPSSTRFADWDVETTGWF